MKLARNCPGLLAGAVLSMAGCFQAWSAAQPEPQPDKALVYFIRTGRMSGMAGSIYLFADRTFVGVLQNGTYGYSYLEPGRRLFWTTWTKATREIDLVPGETYYLDIWHEVSTVDAARRQALIEKVSDLATPDENDRRKATEYIRKKYENALEKEGRREKVDLPEIAPAAVPESREGMLRIPAYTRGVLELMESVTSEFSPAGTEVLLRLTDDVVVEGQVIVRGGTMVKGLVRESTEAGGYGKEGVLEVSVPGLKAGDGTLVPLVAQLVSAGADDADADALATAAGAAAAGPIGGAVGGVLAGLAVRGREAYYLAGERLKVWTRQDAWVPPAAPAVVAETAPAAPVLSLTARCRHAVRFKPRKGYRPDDVTIVLETDVQPTEVSVTSIADLVLPAPLPSKEGVRRSDGWHCTFDGWGLVRYLRVGLEAQHLVTLSGWLDDGRAFVATVGIEYHVER